jgi:hypothetical protein
MQRSPGYGLMQERPGFVPAAFRKSYRISRRDGLWFIDFEGKQFGPYQTDREALLFAIDAAHQFGDKGEETQVQMLDETGDATTVWTYGVDPFPPNV